MYIVHCTLCYCTFVLESFTNLPTYTLLNLKLLFLAEIGHGFGLPHSDENFYNLNLGNCMDYTDRPWSNTSPDKQTFELLQDIYGIPDMGPSDAQLAAAAQQQEGGGDETVIRSESKQSRTPLLRSSRDDEIPSAIAQRAIEAAHHLETNFADPEDDATSTTDLTWTRSRSRSGVQVQQQRNDKFASFQIDLGEGYSLQAHFLIHKPELPSS